MIPGSQAMQNTEGTNLNKYLVEPSHIKNYQSEHERPKKMKRVKGKDKRLPSARNDKDNKFFDNSQGTQSSKMTSSLSRKRKFFDQKPSIPDFDEEEEKEEMYVSIAIPQPNVLFRPNTYKTKRQYSLNSMLLKNQRIARENLNSFEVQKAGWFNEQSKQKEKTNINTFKGNMIYRRSGTNLLYNQRKVAN